MSKAAVAAAYQKIQNAKAEKVKPPAGPLDFHDGNAELLIGKLLYSPAVRTVVRYHGIDVIRVDPSANEGVPGAISALLTDDDGKEILRLECFPCELGHRDHRTADRSSPPCEALGVATALGSTGTYRC